MKKPLVSIIIVNWNGGETFHNCIDSLTGLKDKNWELIVVDNGSADGSEEFAKQVKKARIIKNRENVGFAPANNQGVKLARGKYILLLNNDTKVEKNLLDKLVAKIESDESIGVIQPKIKLMDNPELLDNAGSFITKIGFLNHWGFKEKDRKEFAREREIFGAKGACMLIKKEIIDRMGLFDPDFVSYFEESDFCWRVWLIGKRVIYFPKTYIFHKVGFTAKRMDIFSVNYNSLKNRICSLTKNLDTANLFLVLLPHIVILQLLSLYYLLRLQTRKAKMVFDAEFWNISRLPSTLDKRKTIQGLREVSDRYIFERVGADFDMKEMLMHFKKVEENFK